MGEGQTTYLQRALQSKWLGLGLTGIGLAQLLVVFVYQLLFVVNDIGLSIFIILTIPFLYSVIVLVVFAFLGLIVSIKIALQYKNEEELGIAVFGIIINMLLIIAFVKLPFVN